MKSNYSDAFACSPQFAILVQQVMTAVCGDREKYEKGIHCEGMRICRGLVPTAWKNISDITSCRASFP